MAQAVTNGLERSIPEARPWYSEIDIMEYLGHQTNIGYGTLHYYTFKGVKKSSAGTFKADVDPSKDFHIYALEWEPDQILWYVDGKLYHSTTTTTFPNFTKSTTSAFTNEKRFDRSPTCQSQLLLYLPRDNIDTTPETIDMATK